MAELKRKVSIRRKKAPMETKNSKRFLWLFLSLLVIVPVGIIAIKALSSQDNQIIVDKSERLNTKVNNMSEGAKNSDLNYEEVQKNAKMPGNSVNETETNIQPDAEKQVVAEAQVKVEDAARAVEAVKKATQTSGVDETPTSVKEEGITPATIPDQTAKSEEPATPDTPVSQSPTTKTDDSHSTTPSVTVSSGTLEQEAKYVIRGNYGNGADRKRALGSEYDAIQSKVNEMYRNGEVK